MVANRDLRKGDIILRERATVHGPSMDQSQLICLGCYALLADDRFHPCRKCKAPLCSAKCETHPHHEPECFVFRQAPMGFYSAFKDGVLKKSGKPDLQCANYQLVIPVRTLLLKFKGETQLESLRLQNMTVGSLNSLSSFTCKL